MPSALSASAARRLRESLDEQLSALGEAPFEGDDEAAVAACARAVLRAEKPLRGAVKAAVRGTLAVLADRAPGRSLEVRVPPYGAVQVVEGPRHTRGTPPGVVETDPLTWLRLATGRTSWEQEVSGHRVQASGARSDLSGHLPLWSAPSPGGAALTGRH
ncbi:sterol carrier family protein [Nocardiopsis sp. NPDC101807]|uniref:sterol carrier family protein n=1 Tax=Nocardiopsis sp. NPDC101807 TaxID=3364339 RepID=UPI0037F17575